MSIAQFPCTGDFHAALIASQTPCKLDYRRFVAKPDVFLDSKCKTWLKHANNRSYKLLINRKELGTAYRARKYQACQLNVTKGFSKRCLCWRFTPDAAKRRAFWGPEKVFWDNSIIAQTRELSSTKKAAIIQNNFESSESNTTCWCPGLRNYVEMLSKRTNFFLESSTTFLAPVLRNTHGLGLLIGLDTCTQQIPFIFRRFRQY